MKRTDIIIALRKQLDNPVGRHLYAILGSYNGLQHFSERLEEATLTDGTKFPSPISVNNGILNFFSDEQFREIVTNEARLPDPTRTSVRMAFESFIRESFKRTPILILKDLELIFAYNIDLSPLRTLSTDKQRIILLLPGKFSGKRIVMFPNIEGEYQIPQGIIADHHIWEVTE